MVVKVVDALEMQTANPPNRFLLSLFTLKLPKEASYVPFRVAGAKLNLEETKREGEG